MGPQLPLESVVPLQVPTAAASRWWMALSVGVPTSTPATTSLPAASGSLQSTATPTSRKSVSEAAAMTPALQLRVHCQVPSIVTVRPLTWTLTALSGFGASARTVAANVRTRLAAAKIASPRFPIVRLFIDRDPRE